MRATASPTTSFTSSGSRRSASAVEPTTSANSAVRTLRSSRTVVVLTRTGSREWVRGSRPSQPKMRRERLVDRLVAGRRAGGGLQRGRVAAQPQRAARVVEQRAAPEQRGARCPQGAVAVRVLRTELAAERDQLGQVGDRVGLAEGRDADEPVGVQVVTEEERDVRVGRREQPRRPVVGEIALVDRLQADREARLSERREDNDEPPLVLRPERVLPQRALIRRAVGYLVPHAAIVLSMSSSLCASETNIASNCDGAM